MTHELDDRLRRWIDKVAAGASVSLEAPKSQSAGEGVGVYLLELQRSVPMGSMKAAPLQVVAKYLVTTWAEDRVACNDLLVQLCFAAMGSTDFEIESGAPPLELWRAFGVVPQPALLLRMPVICERPQTRVPIVRHPVRVEIVSRVAFHGKVLGPGDGPLSHCKVAIPALGLETQSGQDGRFEFAGIPSTGSTELLLRARGRELSIRSDQSFPQSGAPMVIHFDLPEE